MLKDPVTGKQYIADYVALAAHRAERDPMLPAHSYWIFVRHIPATESPNRNRWGEFKCIAPLDDGSICQIVKSICIGDAIRGKSLHCNAKGHTFLNKRAYGPGSIVGIENLTPLSKRSLGVPMDDAEKHIARTLDRARIARKPEHYRMLVLRSWTSIPGRARVLFNSAKHSKATKIEKRAFDIDIPWIEERLRTGYATICGAMFGFDLSPVKTPGKPNMYAPSLDRINPSGGYTKSNVQVVPWIYNQLKSFYPEYAVQEFLLAIQRARPARNQRPVSAQQESFPDVGG